MTKYYTERFSQSDLFDKQKIVEKHGGGLGWTDVVYEKDYFLLERAAKAVTSHHLGEVATQRVLLINSDYSATTNGILITDTQNETLTAYWQIVNETRRLLNRPVQNCTEKAIRLALKQAVTDKETGDLDKRAQQEHSQNPRRIDFETLQH